MTELKYVLLAGPGKVADMIQLSSMFGFRLAHRLASSPEAACRAAYEDWGCGYKAADELWVVLHGRLAWQVEIPDCIKLDTALNGLLNG